jgi:FtsH-binding integral membrane protein
MFRLLRFKHIPQTRSYYYGSPEKKIGQELTFLSKKDTLGNDVNTDAGLCHYVSKTYKKVALGSGLSLGILAIAPHFEIFCEHPLAFMLGGFAASIGSVTLMALNEPSINHDESDRPYEISNRWNEVGYWTLAGSMSLMCAPMASVIHFISPAILPAAAVTTASVMGCASLYAYNTNPAKFRFWKVPLMGGLGGLCGIGLIGMVNVLFIHSDLAIFEILHNVNVYAGIGIFAAFTSYDTYEMVEDYKKGRLNHISHATNFYLNFMNLLVRIMEIMAKIKENQ